VSSPWAIVFFYQQTWSIKKYNDTGVAKCWQACIIVFVVTNEANLMKTFHVYYRLGTRKGMITLKALSHKDAEARAKLWYNDAFVLAAVGEKGSEE
jgi:hypothetical protein